MKVIAWLTVLNSGLIAGLLFAYSCSVNIGLQLLADAEYIRAMQSINKAIQNPVFLGCFLGLLLLFPVMAFQTYGLGNSFYYGLSAMLIYFIGVFGITMFFNVPLNELLARFSTATATAVEISQLRQAFEVPWNRYHLIRTVAAILSFALAILAIMNRKF
jgi:uncharacterized membrane protein